jgi:hypothetical protein
MPSAVKNAAVDALVRATLVLVLTFDYLIEYVGGHFLSLVTLIYTLLTIIIDAIVLNPVVLVLLFSANLFQLSSGNGAFLGLKLTQLKQS